MPFTRRHCLLATAATLIGPLAHAKASAPALMLPGVYEERIDPAACLVSEKYDGVRGVWDGRSLRHRSGRAVTAPAWFTARLPVDRPLDGELWLGRGRFDALSATVRRAVPVDAEWRDVRFMVFELPGAPGSFAERADAIATLARRIGWPQLIAVEQTAVADRAALERRLAETVAAGGEGLVLHRADAPFATGRSGAVFKLKPALDAEAEVVGHRPGSGRLQGVLGALELRTPDGVHFSLGTGFSDAQRRTPPALGSIVTYRYRELTPSGRPRFASFLRVHDPL